MHIFTKRLIPFYIALIIFLADLISKHLTHAYLPVMQRDWLWYPYGGIGVFKDFLGIDFSISHQINRGAAWGILSDYQLPLLYARIALIGALLIYAVFFNKHPNRTIPFALIISGAISNVLDYFIYGHVVDMLHFVLWGYNFPTFNLADSAIFIGICWLLIAASFEKKTPPKRAR